MAGFAYVMDKDGEFRNSFNDDWDRILSKHPIPFYYCIGNPEILSYLDFLWNTANLETWDVFKTVGVCFMDLRGCNLLCADWVSWTHSTLLFSQRQWPEDGWVPELLLRMGYLGLFPGVNGSLFRSCHCLCRHLRHSWFGVWFSRCNYGYPKDMAETLPYSHQARAHERVHCGGSSRVLHSPEAGCRARGKTENAETYVTVSF